MTLIQRRILAAVLSAVSISISTADGAAAPPGNQATSAPSVSAEVEAVLDRLEQAGAKVEDLRADITYVVFDTLIEDEQTKPGHVEYRKAEPNAQFYVRFDGLAQEGIVIDKKEWYVFDGRWFTEAHEATRQIIKREIVGEGERIDPFRLGEGPFPLPFGQKKAEILANFAVTLAPPVPGDPANTDHLRCRPLPGTQMAEEYTQLDLFVDRKLDLPTMIIAEQKKENKRITVTFENMRLNTGIPGSDFDFKQPGGWPAPTIERLQRDQPGK
jgi:outer membrane lipoprotein-sorting protein